MEKNATLVKQINKNQHLKPSKQVIDAILNYSKSLDIVITKIGNFIVVNN
jgi:hypothetical protein